jgi:hypothetical protein
MEPLTGFGKGRFLPSLGLLHKQVLEVELGEEGHEGGNSWQKGK